MAEVDTIDIPDVTPVTRTVATLSKLIKTAGLPADAAAIQTDTTALTHTSILKQISKSIQLLVFGAGTAATAQRTTLASDDPAVAVLGAISGAKVITDANGTVQQYLRGLVSQWVAGTLTFASQGFSVALSYARTADANAYTANDVIGTGTGAAGAALTFANAVGGAGEYTITSAALEIDDTAVLSGETTYRLYLYTITPPSALGDNAAFDLPSGDRASFLGYIDLGLIVDLGSTLYVETNIINKQIKAASSSLFGYLVTNGAYTPSSGRTYKITLHTAAV